MQTDQYCLLDLLELLMTDDDSYFLPHHPSFNYKRISVKRQTNDDYPTFQSYHRPIKLNELTWHQTRLNLSLLAKIEGKIKVDNEYDCFIYRNYCIIKDGQLNVQILPVILSDYSYTILKHNGVVNEPSKIYLIDLTTLPVINNKICENMTDSFKLAALALRKQQLENTKPKKINKELDEKEIFLRSIGIRDGCYSPPQIEKDVPKTYESVNAFTIKVIGKVNGGEPAYKNELKLITSQILKIKFALIMCDKWVDKSEVTIDHVKIRFNLEKIKVHQIN